MECRRPREITVCKRSTTLPLNARPPSCLVPHNSLNISSSPPSRPPLRFSLGRHRSRPVRPLTRPASQLRPRWRPSPPRSRCWRKRSRRQLSHRLRRRRKRPQVRFIYPTPLIAHPLHRLPRRYSDRNRDAAAPIVGTSGSTPLHFAAANGHLSVIRTLLSRGAAPDRADKHGITPELAARHNGWVECAEVLAEATAAARPNPLSHQRPPPSCPVEHLEASIRKRLHFKRSVDHSLSSGGVSDPEAKPSLLSSDHESLTQDSRLVDAPASQAIPSLFARRPSLPQALDESSIKTSFPTRSTRPRSAGTGADSRKLHSKLSLLSLFKKSNVDGSSSSVASESPVPPSSPSRPVPILTPLALSSNTPPVSPRSIPTPLSSSPRDIPHFQHKHHRLGASASLTNVRAYPLHPADLHNVLTAERSRNHTVTGISGLDEDSGSADGSISGTPIKSGILRMHNRSLSGQGSVSQPGSLPRSIRFERSASESSQYPGRARSPSTRTQLENRMRSLGIASHEDEFDRIPDTIEESPVVPNAIPPVLVNIIVNHDDDPEEEYGVPLSKPELHAVQDHSSTNSHLPFSINVPPPTDDASAESRLRGDSVSSASTTASTSTYPQSSSSDATWSIATPSTPHLLGSPRIRPALGEYEADLEDTHGIHQRSHRLQFPFDIDTLTISSHAQAEELVQRAQQSIMNMEQCLEQNVAKDLETGRTPLSAKLAAYGESLAIERRLKEKSAAQDPADVARSNGMSLLSATKPSHIYPSPHLAQSGKFGFLCYYQYKRGPQLL